MLAPIDRKQGLEFYGGTWGALLPFFVFLCGVIGIALSGAPDERGFWPILILALTLGLLLSKDRMAFSETVLAGMSEKIVMIMITAWILASAIGVLMTLTGFVDALLYLAGRLDISGTGFVLIGFFLCAVVSLSTGSSFATILICTPLLYPTGVLVGAPAGLLGGAILGGATFGDFIAPISDTTIASTLSQNANLGRTIKSRIKYVLPAGLLATVAYGGYGLFLGTGRLATPMADSLGDPKGLPMLLVPLYIVYLFLKGKHILHGLLLGLLFGTVLGLGLGLLSWTEVLSLDLDNFVAKSFMITGIDRAVGLSIFTILLMGLVATLKASGLMEKLVLKAAVNAKTPKQAEGWIAGVLSVALLLTTHSIVAILMVADFTKKTGEQMEIPAMRRANLLSLFACVYPFILPYFIPVILMANMTKTGDGHQVPVLGPFEVGMHNFMSWGLLAVALVTVLTPWGKPK